MARAKNTDRADARRRYREEQRAAGIEPNTLSEDVVSSTTDAPPARQPLVRMPDVRGDLRAFPGMLARTPLLWVPPGLLLLATFLAVAESGSALPGGPVRDIGLFFLSMFLTPPPMVVPFLGGVFAPRAAWLVGLLMGLLYAVLMTLLVSFSPGSTDSVGASTELVANLLPLWVMSLTFGTLAGAFGAWYRNFLRTSQERARANRAAREREQAAKAKEQARLDKQAGRGSAYARPTAPGTSKSSGGSKSG